MLSTGYAFSWRGASCYLFTTSLSAHSGCISLIHTHTHAHIHIYICIYGMYMRIYTYIYGLHQRIYMHMAFIWVYIYVKWICLYCVHVLFIYVFTCSHEFCWVLFCTITIHWEMALRKFIKQTKNSNKLLCFNVGILRDFLHLFSLFLFFS